LKIIFLDFYGVMDGPLRRDLDRDERLDPLCGARIKDLCDETGARVVIISDAVQMFEESTYTLEEKVQFAIQDLEECGVPNELVIGYTDQGPESLTWPDRPQQIRDWMKGREILSYVIFDDRDLPFSEERCQYTREWFSSNWVEEWGPWEGWEARMPEPDPESFSRFIRVSSRHGLRDEDVARARAILERPVGACRAPG